MLLAKGRSLPSGWQLPKDVVAHDGCENSSTSVPGLRGRFQPQVGLGHRLDWDDVKVAAQLKSRLLSWADDYENGTAGMSEDEFVAEGHELARLLSEELGWEVAYEE
jgi:hypothetical protein